MRIWIYIFVFFCGSCLSTYAQVGVQELTDSLFENAIQKPKNLMTSTDSLIYIKYQELSSQEILTEDFKSQYNSDDYNYFTTEKVSLLNRLTQWFEELIQEMLKWKDPHIEWGKIVNNIIYTIIFLITLYIIFKLIINKEGKWFIRKNKKKIQDIDLDDQAAFNEPKLEQHILSAENNNNWRLAVRYYFILLLQQLDKHEWIKYAPEKTSQDYLKEIKKSKAQHLLDMDAAVNIYNYVWYGKFEIEAHQYQQAKNLYQKILHEVQL